MIASPPPADALPDLEARIVAAGLPLERDEWGPRAGMRMSEKLYVDVLLSRRERYLAGKSKGKTETEEESTTRH